MPDILGHRNVDIGEEEQLSFNWVDELEGTDILIESTWTISPDDSPSPVLSNSLRSDTATTITVNGLTFGIVYQLTNTVVTEDGRTLVKSYTLRGTRK